MHRRAFTLVEMLMVLAILGTVSVFSIPLYNNFRLRSDLALGKAQVVSGLQRAKRNAQAGVNDSVWTFYIPTGTLFPGATYPPPPGTLTEEYPMPSDIFLSGLMMVTYSKQGVPNTTGTVMLQTGQNFKDSVTVQIGVGLETVQTSDTQTITICHQGSTMVIFQADWPAHQAHGDTSGPCAGQGSSSSSAQSSSSSSSSWSATQTTCTSKFSVAPSGLMSVNATTSVTFKALAKNLNFNNGGGGGPAIPIYACISDNNGSSYRHLFHDNGNCSNNEGQAISAGNQSGNTYHNGDALVIRLHGYYSSPNSFSFDKTYTSNDQTGHVIVLRDGDNPLQIPNFSAPTALMNFLAGQNPSMLNAQNKISIGACNELIVSYLNDLPDAANAADFDDAVIEVLFQ